ncbi:MAG TPA: hypothetical protein VGE11_18105 [Pseudonocardia sp.]
MTNTDEIHNDAAPGSILFVARAAILALAISLLVACGGGGAPSLPETASRSAGARPSVTATLPDLSQLPTRPETQLPTRPETTSEAHEPPSPTRSVPKPVPPAEAPTTERPDQPSTEQAVAPPTSATTFSPPAEQPTAPADSTSWLWLFIPVILVAVAVVIPLLLRARRRRTWQENLAAAEGEIAWMARLLIPQLRRAESPEQAAGGWSVGSSRVAALEDRLTRLEDTARDDASRSRARTLRDGVRTADSRLRLLITAEQFDTLPWDLDTVAAELEIVLAEAHAGP